jgi:hypothetical protein
MAQSVFPEGVNTIGAIAISVFFALLVAGALAFLPFFKHARNAQAGGEPVSVWSKPEVRQSFLRFFLIWLAAIACLAVAFVFGGLPTGYE